MFETADIAACESLTINDFEQIVVRHDTCFGKWEIIVLISPSNIAWSIPSVEYIEKSCSVCKPVYFSLKSCWDPIH